MHDKIVILDFGSQYTQLIARKVRELNVYCEIHPFNQFPESDNNIKGVIFSGSPFSVKDQDSPAPDINKIKGNYPLLGICYGAQYIAYNYGGDVADSNKREYGRANLTHVDETSPLFSNITTDCRVWMSHEDTIEILPDNAKLIASTEDVTNAAYKIQGEETYGIQFHPEVYHTDRGLQLLKNFVITIAGTSPDWTPATFVSGTIQWLQNTIGHDEKVVLGLSGGVDSSVTAMLLHKAIGTKLTCIFVDNGLLRKNEYAEVLESYKNMGLNVIGVDAKQRFWDALKGVIAPEEKRKIIGKIFIDVFNEQANTLENVKWLAQGTIYPDIIESVSVNGPSATIKSHHNVGGLPEHMNLEVIEPLKALFKDEVRKAGKELEIPEIILNRHPFPGPGLAIRIIGEITPERIQILQEADNIFIQGLIENNLYDEVWQAGAILLPIQSVGVMGDERTYEQVVALRAIQSTDGMTADFVKLPYNFFEKISSQIINKVRGINRVVYDISSKPPSTIEWE